MVADEAERERRAAARGHASVAEREAGSFPRRKRRSERTYTVRNDGTLDELKQVLSHVLATLEPDP